jgi:PhnB protein
MGQLNQTYSAIIPYLFFNGRCEEAIAFYQDKLGAKVEIVLHFNESPDPIPEGMIAPGFENKVMHSSFSIRGTSIMASDGCGGPNDAKSFDGFALTLSVKDEADANAVYDALAGNGGQAITPLGPTFFSPCYGQVRDKFGVQWFVIVPAPMP